MTAKSSSVQAGRPAPAAPTAESALMSRLWPFRAPVLVALLLTLAALAFWYLYTGQIWEDFLITLRHSRNAALGNGLVFMPGERIHGFTSPLNVLLPTAIMAFRPTFTPETVLAIYNVVALLLMGVTLAPLYRRLVGTDGWSKPLMWLLFPLAVGLNVKLCSFAMNGQEAAFTVAFLSVAFVALWEDTTSTWKLLGFSWGGLMWTRPDSPILVAALALAFLLFSGLPRKQVVVATLKAAAFCTVVYAPWIIWATWYYGTPIPHTILAKQLYTHTQSGSVLFWAEKFLRSFWSVLPRPFTPAYAEVGGWSAWYNGLTRALTFAACFYWIVPTKDRVGRVASLVCLGWVLYQTYVNTTARAFPWYFPAAGFAGTIALFRGLQTLASFNKSIASISLEAAVIITATVAYGYFPSLAPTRLRQIYIEDGVRRQVGLWLKDHVRQDERIYLEPIGYIGYFSERALYDYPGLVSPKVVQMIRENNADFTTLIGYLAPRWVVLRPHELVYVSARSNLLELYEEVQFFDTTPDLRAMAGKRIDSPFYADWAFHVLRRRN